MRRAFVNLTGVAACLALLPSGCSSPPKTADAYGPGTPAPAQAASWYDPVTAPFKSKPAAAKPEQQGDPTSLSTGLPKPNADLFVSSAKLHEKNNDNAGAAGEYEKALKVDANYLPALMGYAHLKDRGGDLKGATQWYVRAGKGHPKDASVHNDLGICYARQGMLTESSAELSKAVELQPDKKLYRNNLAQLQVEQNHMGEAFVNLKAAHGESIAHYNLGYLLNQKGSSQAAAEQFALALRSDPTFAQAQQMLDRVAAKESLAQGPATTARGATPDVVPQVAPAANVRAEFETAANPNPWASRGASPWRTGASQASAAVNDQFEQQPQAPQPAANVNVPAASANVPAAVQNPGPSAWDNGVPPTPDQVGTYSNNPPADKTGGEIAPLPPLN